jgi:hypothetical protein
MENQNQNTGSEKQTINIQVPSANNIASKRPLIPVSFALAIILFFFTFCDFKCGGEKIGSVTGINLVTGTEIGGNDMFSGERTKGERVPPSIWAIFAFGAAIIGFGAFLIKEKREALIGTGAGIIGVGSLLILYFAVDNAVKGKGEREQIEVVFQFGYYGALLALAIAGFISYLRIKKAYTIVVNAPPSSASALPNIENVSQQQTSVSPISQTNNFDLASFFKKNRVLIIALIVLIVGGFGGYKLLVKNSYQKTISYVKQQDWSQAKYYYEKAINEKADGELKLSYDEEQGLKLIGQIINTLNNVLPQMRKLFYTMGDQSDPNDVVGNIYNQLDKLQLNYFLSQSIPNLDIKKLLKPVIQFNDSMCFIQMKLVAGENISAYSAQQQRAIVDEKWYPLYNAVQEKIIDKEDKNMKMEMDDIKKRLDNVLYTTNPPLSQETTNPPPTNSTATSVTKSYTGSVSKLEVSYNLIWNSNGTIEGTYYYAKKPGTKYILKGKDLGNGNIQLTEYTGNNVSANCNLSLQGKCYVGKMNNTDGRTFNMTMCQ